MRLPGYTWLALLSIATPSAYAQKPVISGVVNAASFVAPPGRGSSLAPGSIASIFGQNLSPATREANSVPLPFDLAGVHVTLDGLPAALYYVSPAQLNIQVPAGLFLYGQQGDKRATLVVATDMGTSDSLEVQIASDAAGIFTLNASGCGAGAVLNALPDGRVELHGPTTSVQPGDWVSVFFTGYGLVRNMPPDGQVSPLTTGADHPYPGPYLIASRSYVPAVSDAWYWGKAPGTVGLDQVNLRIPEGAPEGCKIPLRLGVPHGYSQPVPLSIHTGRGACVVSPISLALIEWRKTVFNDRAAAEELYIRLNQAEGNAFPNPPELVSALYNPIITPPGPDCANLLPKGLDGGLFTGQPPSGASVRSSSPVSPGGEITNSLPNGTITPGRHSISTLGGADVGPFTSSTTIPPPLQVTSSFPASGTVSCFQPLTVQWTGADDTGIVQVRLRTFAGGIERDIYGSVLGSVGSTTFRPLVTPGQLPIFCGVPAEIDITQTPRPDMMSVFAANGLTLGGQHTWKYEFRFENLRMSASP